MRRIEDYALLGDLQTAALVHRSGDIEWCCFPRFDSAACFAALLGSEENGTWQLGPVDPVLESTRSYRDGTLILDTVVRTETGVVRITDFMPPRSDVPDIVRIVEGIEGEVAMRSRTLLRFGYGNIVPWVRAIERGVLAVAGPDAVILKADCPLHGENAATVGEFTVTTGESVSLVMTWFPSYRRAPWPVDAVQSLQDTEAFWRSWSERTTYNGPYRRLVHRSLMVLKALTYQPSGGIVAAPTTSLPEWLGSVRNWDYRYCWLRDASLTLIAMMQGGHHDEALAWRNWLLRAIAGDTNRTQIMYGIAGERWLEERELPWLAGFADSTPVRIGNAASNQVQLDVHGEVAEALYMTRYFNHADSMAWSLETHMLDWLEQHWMDEDAGIWEVRGPNRDFTHSKAMAWVAFDRAVRSVEEGVHEGPVDRWRSVRDEIHAEVMTRGWSESRQSFTQYFDGESLDASLLQLAIMGFIEASHPRMIATVDAIMTDLMEHGLLLRYRITDPEVDGLPPGEGAFLACSFWLVQVLAMQGRIDEAGEIFDRVVAYANDLDLLAEEVDPVAGIQLGNFPQAFTHLTLVNAAMALRDAHERISSGEHRTGDTPVQKVAP